MASPPTKKHADGGLEDDHSRRLLLLLSVVIVGACGLLYELALGAVASYLMGDSVTQYSLVIGAFLASMGLGAWLSQWVRRDLFSAFLTIQLAVGLIGGFSALAVFMAFAHTDQVTLFVVLCSAAVGTLVGMEIPLILRLLHGAGSLRVTVAHVLTADYIGALAASVAFPFVVLPLLGLVRAGLAFGMLNVAIGTFGTALFWGRLDHRRSLVVWNIVAWLALLVGIVWAGETTAWIEDRLYQDEIIFAETTPYQRIVITRWKDDYRLHLGGHLQFTSADEYRYHEPLVLPALSAALQSGRPAAKLRVLILGGGDGLAARQVFAAADVGSVDLVDIDRRVVEIFRERRQLRRLNDGALSDPRLTAHYEDAFTFLRDHEDRWDVIIIDLPDPSSPSTNKLYSTTFFGLALRRLTDRGVLVTQASSPFYARRAFWCIHHTMQAALERLPGRGGRVTPYHAYVPSFGEWGFVMVTPDNLPAERIELQTTGRFLTQQVFDRSRIFSPDMAEVPTEINGLEDPVLVRYHTRGWSRWGE